MYLIQFKTRLLKMVRCVKGAFTLKWSGTKRSGAKRRRAEIHQFKAGVVEACRGFGEIRNTIWYRQIFTSPLSLERRCGYWTTWLVNFCTSLLRYARIINPFTADTITITSVCVQRGTRTTYLPGGCISIRATYACGFALPQQLSF